jgi:glycosyltransferase involved in cell wall biosynthesis
MSAPRLTIGLPVYNGENFLREAIVSILAQTYTDFELVISDNGSTDATPAICRAAAASDPRVRYVRHDENRGAGWNYEHVRSLATGTDFYKWAAHDDVLAATFLERCVAALDADPGASLAFTGVAAIDHQGAVTKLKRNQVEALGGDPGSRFRQVLASNANPEAVFGVMRRSALAHTRGQGDYISSDRVLLAELALVGSFVEVPEPLVLRRDHTHMSRRANATLEEISLWFDPDAAPTRNETWRLFREHVVAVGRADLPAGERALALATLLQAWGERRWLPAAVARARSTARLRTRAREVRGRWRR